MNFVMIEKVWFQGAADVFLVTWTCRSDAHSTLNP